MKEKINAYFKTWWIPVACNVVPLGMLIIDTILKIDFIIDVSLVLFYINIIGILISSVVQIFIKKWYLVIPQIGITSLLFYCVSIIFTYSPPDYYGVYKTIPTDIEISEPAETKPTEKEFEKYDLIVSSSFQPGIYEYATDFKPTIFGYFYIKAFEINSNDRLSEERINEESKINVDYLEMDNYSGGFTIYEGSWGDKYAARIELWFHPIDESPEIKIAERNYIVEGWMR